MEVVEIPKTQEKKIYDSKQYYINFKNKHNDKIHERIVCDMCGGSYSYFNKSKHNKSKKHKKTLEDIEKTKIKYDKYLLKEL